MTAKTATSTSTGTGTGTQHEGNHTMTTSIDTARTELAAAQAKMDAAQAEIDQANAEANRAAQAEHDRQADRLKTWAEHALAADDFGPMRAQALADARHAHADFKARLIEEPWAQAFAAWLAAQQHAAAVNQLENRARLAVGRDTRGDGPTPDPELQYYRDGSVNVGEVFRPLLEAAGDLATDMIAEYVTQINTPVDTLVTAPDGPEDPLAETRATNKAAEDTPDPITQAVGKGKLETVITHDIDDNEIITVHNIDTGKTVRVDEDGNPVTTTGTAQTWEQWIEEHSSQA